MLEIVGEMDRTMRKMAFLRSLILSIVLITGSSSSSSFSFHEVQVTPLESVSDAQENALSNSIPQSWRKRVENSNMFYHWNDSTVASNKMPMIGNGFVGTIIGSESFFVSGMFSGLSDKSPSQRARFPATLNVDSPGKNGHCALDVARAAYFRRSYVEPNTSNCTAKSNVSCTNADSTIWVEQRWYAHQVYANLLVMEIEVLPNDDEPMVALDNYPLAVLALNNSSGKSSDTLKYNVTKEGEIVFWNGTNQQPETKWSRYTQFAVASTEIPRTLVINSAGVTHYFVTAVRTSLETFVSSPHTLVDAVRRDYNAAMRNAESLWRIHAEAWEGKGIEFNYAGGKWEAGISIDNRQDVSAAINSSFYAILSSIREDRPYSLSPGGLTDGYHGHTFWDAETWMYPPILMMDPNLARSILFYRRARLLEAYDKAQSYSNYNYSGAMFPWESAFTGVEACPVWAPTGLREIHISGDIAFAFHQYWSATNGSDISWFYDQAMPVLSGIADFWVSKATIDSSRRLLCQALKNSPQARFAGREVLSESLRSNADYLANKFCNYSTTIIREKYLGKQFDLNAELSKYQIPACSSDVCRDYERVHESWYEAVYELAALHKEGTVPLHIDDVIPPDEYHDHVNDSVYTNSVAKISLLRASHLAERFGLFPQKRVLWKNVAERIVILYNETDHIHPEFKNYDGSTIKQADVVLIYFPLQVQFGNVSTKSMRADLEYYADRTSSNGPAMTWSMYAIEELDLGNYTEAAIKFNRSFANIQEPFKVWTETPSGGTPNFITGAGGFLQGVMFGYGGLRLYDDSIQVTPKLFPGSTRVHVRKLYYANTPFEYEYDRDHVRVRMRSTERAKLSLTLSNGTTLSLEEQWTQLPIQTITIRAQF